PKVVAQRFRFRRRVGPERLADFEHRDLAHFPLVEHLHGGFAGVMPDLARGAVGRATFDARGHPPIASSNLRNSFAISRAASAAPRPFLSPPLRERSTACSSVKVVNTPKAIGTPVAAAACMMPFEAASAMYSKCIVSPLIRQPRQTIASYSPLSPSRCAVIGISNAPGTWMIVTFSSGTDASASRSRAPRSSPSVISPLKRETTTAKR